MVKIDFDIFIDSYCSRKLTNLDIHYGVNTIGFGLDFVRYWCDLYRKLYRVENLLIFYINNQTD